MILINEQDPMITSNYYRSFEYVTLAALKEGPQAGRSLFVKNLRLRPDTDLQRISNLLETVANCSKTSSESTRTWFNPPCADSVVILCRNVAASVDWC